MLPQAIVVGCTIQEFWYGDPQNLWAYIKAHEKYLNAQLKQTNFAAWLNGRYMINAVAVALDSKNNDYPKEPLHLFGEEESQQQEKTIEQLREENEAHILARAAELQKLLSQNAKPIE